MNKSIRDLFDYLNNNCTYLILRNWDSLDNENIYSDGHEDIDILCSSLKEFVNLTKPLRVHPESSRDNYFVSWNGDRIRFDVRWVGDGYYPKEMERLMLEHRVLNNQGFYVPNGKDHYYSLAYHALIQKTELSDEYKRRLSDICRALFNKDKDLTGAAILEDVRNYLLVNNWKVEYPSDPGVFLNKAIMKELPVRCSIFRCINRATFVAKQSFQSNWRRFLGKV